MKTTISTLLLVVGVCAAAAGCFHLPTEPAEACERERWADVEFHNGSQRSNYDIVVNGSIFFEGLRPGGVATYRKLAAGVTHNVVFRHAGTSLNACTPSTLVLTACTPVGRQCSADR